VATKVQGAQSISKKTFLFWYTAHKILSYAIEWPQKGSCSVEKANMLGYCFDLVVTAVRQLPDKQCGTSDTDALVEGACGRVCTVFDSAFQSLAVSWCRPMWVQGCIHHASVEKV